jgi:hypothetical protein
MPEFRICAVRDNSGERELLESWLSKWRGRDTIKLSQNEGCGCCVDIYRVTGPDEAMREVPAQMLTARVESKKHGA